MTEITLQQKIAAVDRLLNDLRWARAEPGCAEHETFHALKAIASDLRAQTPQEISRVRAAMTDQINRANRAKHQLGHFEYGNMVAITEALCGRWWPTVERALKDKEIVS